MPYLHGLFILYLEIYTFCLPLLILPTSHPLATIICSDELSFFKKKKRIIYLAASGLSCSIKDPERMGLVALRLVGS